MKPHVAQNALVFLQRSDIKGAEIDAFLEVVNALKAFIPAETLRAHGMKAETDSNKTSLIAAAPEMLEALENVLQKSSAETLVRCGLLHEIRAAIAKAKGEQ